MNTNKEIRQPAVAGQFYPASANQLTTLVENLYREATPEELPSGNIRGLIAPHAGYYYSGYTAAKAFALLNPDAVFDNIFLIGNSHQSAFRGAAIFGGAAFETPLGRVICNTTITSLLAENPLFGFDPSVHEAEHSLEVMLPFLQIRLSEPFTIVPVLLGTSHPGTCRQIAGALKPWFTHRNLFVISTDLSHYPDASTAAATDALTAGLVAEGDPGKLYSHLSEIKSRNDPSLLTAMCGAGAVLTLMYLCLSEKEINLLPVDYSHSGMTGQGNRSRVVGYQAMAAIAQAAKPFGLNAGEKEQLLETARRTIEREVLNEPYKPDPSLYSGNLNELCGVFVSVYVKGKLRGCIGRFEPDEPLWKVTGKMARAAAFTDLRFEPVGLNDLDDLEIEISVLTPMRPITSAEEFIPGHHGIYIRKGYRAGTFLPQVADSTGWNRYELLSHCSSQKAGLGPDGWKEAELFVYEAIVFGREKH